MPEQTIRRATEDDQEAIGALWATLLDEQAALEERMGVAEDARERWNNDFPMWLEDDTRRIFVADADAIVGFVSARRWGAPPIYKEEDEVFLDELYVVPDERRKGVGTRLVSAVRDWADELGARRIRLSVLAANTPARDFWAAQEAQPMTITLTMDCPGAPEAEGDDEGTKKIGF